jgi:hypothetical protein
LFDPDTQWLLAIGEQPHPEKILTQKKLRFGITVRSRSTMATKHPNQVPLA